MHIPAIAYEAGVEFDIEMFDDISRSTPLVAKMNPAAACNVIDFFESGGVPVVMNEIVSLLHKEAMTVTGRTIGENIRGQVSPEAMEGGPIPLARDGDVTAIDIPGKRLDLKMAEAELDRRRVQWKPPEPRVNSGYLYLYNRLAESADNGAVIRTRAD